MVSMLHTDVGQHTPRFGEAGSSTNSKAKQRTGVHRGRNKLYSSHLKYVLLLPLSTAVHHLASMSRGMQTDIHSR